jgi:hypothetical protein
VNGWRSGAALLVNGAEVVRNNQLFSVRGQLPVISTTVESKRVDIHVKALTRVTIQVRVGGVPIHDGFI